ncbi:pyrroloquinoline quinone biosynthesis protein B [Actinocorallia herbida]|uniref:Coenzyme PQQ synthesis protein B n=1 Tax=Actinocorallia herbida TaxID=58109 RepID=A0A3N1D0W9_9ACTN|nr:pyrroloquinoline quinone biosynthesis protein PqqB [Actinocorallia herbida]ROO87172.1 pyrroloquinoline quinone biosynthesis protein B [Actinocorallia herbida]
MRLRVLGTAAGGGVPQWNCACEGCGSARRSRGLPRRHASIAVETAPGAWFLVNAAPDVTEQIEAFPELRPGPGARRTPVAGVVLTDAELDHTLGLFRLREAARLRVLAPPAVLAAVTEGLSADAVLGPYAGITWDALPAGETVRLGDIEVAALPVSDKRPRYAAGLAHPGPWSTALEITDVRSGRRAVYSPCVADWSDPLQAALDRADVVFLDGTFWDDDEPRRAGFTTKTATEMGHLPITRTSARLARLTAPVRLYTHLNNTNPLVDPAAPQHRVLADLGLAVAAEGDVIEP